MVGFGFAIILDFFLDSLSVNNKCKVITAERKAVTELQANVSKPAFGFTLITRLSQQMFIKAFCCFTNSVQMSPLS